MAKKQKKAGRKKPTNASRRKRTNVPQKKRTDAPPKRRTSKRPSSKASGKVSAAKGVKPGYAANDFQSIRRELELRSDALSEERELAEAVLAKRKSEILAQKGVTGVGVDFKMSDNRYLQPLQVAICITVEVKLHERHELFKDRTAVRFPKKYDSVPVDIRQRIYRSADCDSQEENIRHDPLRGGVAIASSTNARNWGTLGIRVLAGGEIMYLTNRHITGSQIGSNVQQPPFAPNLPPSQHLIGTVSRVCPRLDPFVDAGLIRPNGSRQSTRGLLGPNTGILPGRMQCGALTLGDQFVTRVTIVGAATGSAQLREGIVTNISQNVRIPEIRNEVFEDQILVLSEDNSRIICPGDSGSVLIKHINDANGITNLIVGLAFASVEDGTGLVANHIHHVSTSLLGIGFEE